MASGMVSVLIPRDSIVADSPTVASADHTAWLAKRIGAMLRAARASQGRTINQLQDDSLSTLGICFSQNALSLYERGERVPSLSLLIALAAAYNLSLSRLARDLDVASEAFVAHRAELLTGITE